VHFQLIISSLLAAPKLQYNTQLHPNPPTMSGPSSYSGVKPPDHNLALGVVPFIWTFTAISAVVLALRLFAVYHVLRRVRAADYTMVAAFVRPTRYPLTIQCG
jgi:hypothetical protein